MVRGMCLWPVLGRSRGPVSHYCGLLQGPLCEGVGEDLGAWYIVSRISFHGMTCRTSYRIDIFLLECDFEMLSEHCMCT